MKKKTGNYPELRLQEHEWRNPGSPDTGNSWIPAFAGMTKYSSSRKSGFFDAPKMHRH